MEHRCGKITSKTPIDQAVRGTLDSDWCGGLSFSLTQSSLSSQFGSFFAHILEAAVPYADGVMTSVVVMARLGVVKAGGGGISGSGRTRRGGALTALLNTQ